MSMLLEKLDFAQRYDFTLVLTKKNKKPIGILKEAYARSLNVKMEDINKISFNIPYYIEDTVSHEQIKNSNYDDVIVENMILLKCGVASQPLFQAYFVIKNVTESTDKLSKQVNCSSREVVLNKKVLTLDGVERQLKKDDVNTADGIFDFLESETSWSLGYLDPNAKVEHINGGTNNKYRWFDALSKPWFQFLKEDASSSFNIVLMYNSYDKTIDCYDRDNYGSHTGIILSEDNYIKNLSVITNGENIVTKLHVTGRDDSTFESVNPLGTDYIYNFDYFRNNGQMSDELVYALDKYDILVNEKNTEFQNLKAQIDDLNAQIVVKNGEMTTLNEELVALRHIQSGYMSANDNNVNLPQSTTDVNNKVIEIANKQVEINNLNSQINNINIEISQIASDITMTNAKDTSGNLIFNEDLLSELEDFTYEESWQNSYFDSTQTQQLYQAGIAKLKDWSIPPIEFQVDSVDLFATMELQHYWDKIKLGDFVRFYSDRLKINIDMRIVEYTYDIDSNSLKFTFSNKIQKLDDARGIGTTVRKANDSSKVINTKKLEWDNIKDTKNAVDTFLNNALDLAKQNVVAQMGQNKIDISENGIWISNANDNNQCIALLSGLIAITNDGWQTCSTAIDSSGVYAEQLIGRVLLGENLFIEDTTGQFQIVGNLLTIKDNNNKTRVKLGQYDNTVGAEKYGLQLFNKTGDDVVLSEDGMISEYSFSMTDNVDSNHNMKIKFYISDNLLSVKQVKIAFSCEAFRTYEQAVVGGSSSISTSSSAGSHRHLMLRNLMESSPAGDIATYYGFAGTSSPSQILNTEIYLPMISSPGSSDIYTYESTGNHSHGMSHTHDVSITYGIYESTVAQDVKTTIDGTLRYDNNGLGYNGSQVLDITQYIQTSGLHEIQLSSSQLGRISCTVYVKSFVST